MFCTLSDVNCVNFLEGFGLVLEMLEMLELEMYDIDQNAKSCGSYDKY